MADSIPYLVPTQIQESIFLSTTRPKNTDSVVSRTDEATTTFALAFLVLSAAAYIRTLALVVVICLIVVVGLGVVGLVVATAPPIWKFTIAPPSDRESRQQPQTTRRVKRYVLEKCIYYSCQFHGC